MILQEIKDQLLNRNITFKSKVSESQEEQMQYNHYMAESLEYICNPPEKVIPKKITPRQKARDIEALDRYIPKLEGRKDCKTALRILLGERMRLSLELENKK